MFIRGSKYGAVKITHAGMSFASKLEAGLYDYLCWLEKAKELKDIQCQSHVFLTRARIEYIADFKVYDTLLCEEVYYEAKGVETPTWRIKRKLWKVYGPGRLRVFKGRAESLTMTEEIIGENK